MISTVNLFGASTKNDIKVGYISTTRGYVTGVGINDANIYAQSDPGTKFILQNRDYIKYLNINQVNKLEPDVLITSQENKCEGVKWEEPIESPRVIFAGGGGVGVVGNPIIGDDGAVLAVDLVSGGFGYKYAPVTKLKEVSGKGAGASLVSVIGGITTSEVLYDKLEDFEEYVIETPDDVPSTDWYGPDGKVIGKWDPSLYTGDTEVSFDVITDEYIEKLQKIASSGIGGGISGTGEDQGAGVFWWVAKTPPNLVTGDGKTTRKIYKVQHVAWNETPPPVNSEGNITDWSTNGWMNKNAISPIPMSSAKGSDAGGKVFTLEWDVEFPWDGKYTFKGCADNEATIYLDNQQLTHYELGSGGAAGKVLSLPSIIKKEVKEGMHKLRIDLKNHQVMEEKKVQASSKTYGSLLQLEDIPNVAAEDQGGVTYDDLQCYAKVGRFFDINANKAKYKVDPSLNQPEGSELEVEYKVTSSSAFVNKIVVKDLFTEQGPEVVTEESQPPTESQRKASANFISRGSGQSTEYYMTVTGNDLLEINFEFRSHQEDSTRGTGLSVETIIIQSEKEPIELNRASTVTPSSGWPFGDAMITTKKGTFKHGKEYRVTFRGTRWQENNAPAPDLFNNAQGIAFYDNDTSDGATSGPDLDGDVRAHFNIKNVKQLTDEVPSIPGELKLKQLNKTFKKTVIVGKVYPVTVSNAGQGLMGNTPAPIGALRAKDIINQDAQVQNNTQASTQKYKVFNTIDSISSANRKLWKTNVNNKDGFKNEYGICPFDTLNTLPDNPYAGTHTIKWNYIDFPISGNYNIMIAVDDNVDLTIGNSANPVAVKITKEGYVYPKGGGIKSTGVGNYVRYIEAGRYSIQADLTQIPGGRFGWGKIRGEDDKISDAPSGIGLNPMGLAIKIETSVASFTEAVESYWHHNPLGVALNIRAPLPPAPVQSIPLLEGRCPRNPVWSTRFPNAKNGTWYPVRFDSWGEFHNKYGMSPVPPLPTGGSDHGGIWFTNTWDVEVEHDGFYKLKAIIDDVGKISIDGDVKLELSNDNKVETGEATFELKKGIKEVKVEIKNNSTRKENWIDQKIFNTADWINLTPKMGGDIQQVDFKLTSSSAFVNSINIKGLFYEQGPALSSVKATKENIIPGTPIPAKVEFIQRGGKYYLKAYGNKRVKVKFDFRVHEDDKNIGGGPSIRFVTIQTMDSPKRFDTLANTSMSTWPFVGSTDVKDAIFENGKEYEVNFGGLLSRSRSTQPIQYIGLESSAHRRFANSKTLEFDDHPDNGWDTNATFTIVSGDVTFSEDGTRLLGTKCESVTLTYSWNDDPNTAGVVLDEIKLGGQTWKQSGQTGSVTRTINFIPDPNPTSSPLIGGMATPTICFFDGDTSAGATIGPDFNGDVRAYITALNVIQMDEPDPVEGEPVDVLEKKLVQLDGSSPIVRDVVVGQVYDVEIANAGQGTMGNYPAPVGALKVNGGIVMLEDLPDVDAGSQGGITYDDLVCSASHGKFYDVQGNKCKFKIDPPTTGKAVRNGITYNGPTLSSYGSHEDFGPLITPKWETDEEYIRTHNGTTWVMTFNGVDFPETGEYDIKAIADDKVTVKIDNNEVISDVVKSGNAPRGVTYKKINVNKGKRNLELILENKDFGASYWKNPVVAGVYITRKVDSFAGTTASSDPWMINPISISAELVPPPCPRIVEGGGVVTEVIIGDPGNGYPKTPGPGIPYLINLDGIEVDDPGINYDCSKDKVVIDPPNGAEATLECDNFGRIKKVNVVNPGIGYTGWPEIYIDSPTGVTATLRPKLTPIRDPLPGTPGVPEVDLDKLIQVTDLVGVKQTGYYDGRPYYGAVFYKEGVRYAGYYETTGRLVQIYDTLQESIDGMVTTPPSAIQRQGTDIASDDPNLNIPNTPDNLI